MLARMKVEVRFERMMDESGPTYIEIDLVPADHKGGALTMPTLPDLMAALNAGGNAEITLRGMVVGVRSSR